MITFSFDSGDAGLAPVTKTVNDVTLTVSNFSNGNSRANANGLCFAGSTLTSNPCGNLSSLTLSFSTPVQLISYGTGQLGFPAGTLNLTFSDGVNSSVQTFFSQGNTTNFNNQFSVAANQTISVTRSFPGAIPPMRNLLFNQLTVDATPTPVPEPLTLLGAMAATGFGAAFKRWSGKAQQK